jgi:hypothetical protein
MRHEQNLAAKKKPADALGVVAGGKVVRSQMPVASK